MSDLWGYGWRMGSLNDLSEAGHNTDEWDRWQGGSCLEYAQALKERFPHLGIGTLSTAHLPAAHFFAHDDTHAYDSAGAHPLPYYGVHGDMEPELGQELDWYDEPDPDEVAAAHQHIERHRIGPRTAARLGGANGDLPENLHFREHRGWTHAYDGEHLIGYLRPAQGKIDMIKVAPEYRRQGIGTAMLDWHRNNVDPDLGHSTDQTPLGRAWGRSVGWNPPVWNRQDPDIDTLEDYEVERGPHTAARLAMPAPLQFPIEHLEPHNLYDPVAATDSDHYPDLVRHIREHGVQMPITLETDGELGLVADGNHRLAAAREAGLTHLPVRFLRESTRNLERWGGTPLHPAIQQHLADNPASIASTYDRQPSWAQGDYITSSRLAMPIYYHVTPRRNVDSIRQHGLDYTKGEAMWHHDGATPGNYFWDHPGHADQYANELDERDQQEYGSMNWDEENDGHVVLPFNHDALALPDPENEWNDEMEGRSFYSPDPIPAAAFHHTASHTASRLAMPNLNKAISDFAQNGYSEEPERGYGDCLSNSLSFMEGLHPSFNPRLHQFFLPTVSAFPNPAREDLQHSESDPGHWETDELVDDGVYAPADHYAPVINHQGRDHVVDWTMSQFDPRAKVPHIEPLDQYSKRFSYDEPTTEFDAEWKKGPRIAPRLAMPSEFDVYDGFYDEDEYNPDERPEPHDGPWYHYSPTKLPVGTHLTPGHDSPWGNNLYEKDGTEHRRNYVWLSPSVTEAVGWAGLTPKKGDNGRGYIYRVEPSSNVLPWNGTGSDGWVADGAHIAEELSHPWKEPHTAARLAMPSEDYQGQHRPGGPDHGAPFHDLNQMWGDDIYEHPEWYDSMDYGIKNIQRQLNEARGNPDHPVVIYRAIPSGKTDINTGDWITTSLPYAREHAVQSENPDEDWPIVRSTVPAKHVWTNNDLHEWGYHGPNVRGEIVNSNINQKKAHIMTAAVTVYTKPNCPQCTMTKKQLDRLGIEHRVIDVTVDPDAHAYVTGLGYQQAPVVVVGDGEQHWGGFSPDKLKGLLS